MKYEGLIFVLALDSHAHCGLTLPLEELRPLWNEAGIDGGVLFSPVEEIYDRNNRNFTDSERYRQSREKVHAYLEGLISEHIFAYWFVWNDFKTPPACFSGVKWHRHSNEPRYRYDAKECEAFINHICNLRLPIVLEEEFHHTLELVKRIAGRTPVIIPHFGGLNGGYERLKAAGLFENPSVYVDTALAAPYEISDFAADYGVDRILFGSDFPFGEPAYERYKVERIFSGKDLEKVLARNLLALLKFQGLVGKHKI
ncbi:MAG: amidohydrolase family protein [Firmicutes bacterium]|nr:amidohydrolase family protein [Bacillota bacterium]